MLLFVHHDLEQAAFPGDAELFPFCYERQDEQWSISRVQTFFPYNRTSAGCSFLYAKPLDDVYTQFYLKYLK